MSAGNDTPWLRVTGLHFSRGDQPILQDIAVTIGSGETTLLTGHNGSGKTTLLRILAGLLQPDAGSFDFGQGADRWQASRRLLRAEICYLHQQPYLFDGTVFDNIAYGLRQRRMPRDQINARVREALRTIELEPLATRHCRALSGGEQQRVAMARAWVLTPRLMLLDEPVANMDKRSRRHCLALINRLREEQISIILTSHDPQHGTLTLDRHLHLYRGAMSEKDPVDEGDEGADAQVIPFEQPPPVDRSG